MSQVRSVPPIKWNYFISTKSPMEQARLVEGGPACDKGRNKEISKVPSTPSCSMILPSPALPTSTEGESGISRCSRVPRQARTSPMCARAAAEVPPSPELLGLGTFKCK